MSRRERPLPRRYAQRCFSLRRLDDGVHFERQARRPLPCLRSAQVKCNCNTGVQLSPVLYVRLSIVMYGRNYGTLVVPWQLALSWSR